LSHFLGFELFPCPNRFTPQPPFLRGEVVAFGRNEAPEIGNSGWLKSRAGKQLKFRRDEKGFALQKSGIEHQLLSI
jgi:hypothetical protein